MKKSSERKIQVQRVISFCGDLFFRENIFFYTLVNQLKYSYLIITFNTVSYRDHKSQVAQKFKNILGIIQILSELQYLH